MNKSEFIDHIAKQHNCTKVEAEKTINMFSESVISALSEDKDIVLIGFGKFYTSKVAERDGSNPRSGQPLKIAAHTQPKFSAGEKLKSACNKDKKAVPTSKKK
jgi:DNA-binding protein HU-beta